MVEQSTRPQTIGYSLADSPVGLLAWIYEKLVTWTDEYPWEDDEGQYPRSPAHLARHSPIDPAVLTWISIYLFSLPGPAESVRIYYELVNAPGFAGFTPAYSPTPVGCSYFPKELFVMPKSYVFYPRIVFDA